MNDPYLDEAKRKFYDKALAHIRACGDKFWDLDDNLDNHIDNINRNDNVRTMYSRRGKNRTGFGLESYLTICYTQEIENKIKDEFVPRLNSYFADNKQCSFVTYYNPPRVDIDNEEAAEFLKYIEHPDYWNILNLKLELKGGNSEEHDKFWNLLSGTLSKL
jgi:hypothetical protein